MRWGLLAAAVGLGACGGNVQLPGEAGGTTGSGGSTTASGTTTTSASATTTTTGGSVDCEAAAGAIANMLVGVGTCTAVVRLDYQTKAILGWQVECGSYAAVDETTARATAQMDTGQGQGESIAGSTPQDEFVFWQSAGDFGGSAVVAQRDGKSVFGGTTVWGGMGDITYPKTWLPASSLGACSPVNVSLPMARGFALDGGLPLDDASVQAALSVVWGTALPVGMAKVEYIFDAMVLKYPRTVGASDPKTTEWIVLVNGGYLE